MTINIGAIDRIFRFVLGIILLALPLTMAMGTAATVISVIVGLVLIGTAAVKFCPLYRIVGIRTCKI